MREKINAEDPHSEKTEDKMFTEPREREINPSTNINMVNETTEHENNSINSLNVKETEAIDIDEIMNQAKITQDGSEYRCLINKLCNIIKEKDVLINRLTLPRTSSN